MTRDELSKICLEKLKENNYNGVLCLGVGSGKSKIAIEAIKQGNFKNILITSPRTNLKESWRSELKKWGLRHIDQILPEFSVYSAGKGMINITLENIQTCYKRSEKLLKQFDLIIVDEYHTLGEEYFQLIKNAQNFNITGSINQIMPVPIIGLTGTPNKEDKWKSEVLYKTLPILYEYYDSSEDGITNKIKVYVYQYELSDSYKVLTGTKDKKWLVGEAKQYAYLSEQYEKAKNLMFLQGASNYFEQCLEWMQSKEATKEQKEAGRKFFYAIKNRKEFLWNLESSKQIALDIKMRILANSSEYNLYKECKDYVDKNKYSSSGKLLENLTLVNHFEKFGFTRNENNKVLLFSELTQQAEKLSPYSLHSNNGKTTKECEQINKDLLERFNSGKLRELSSVNSLTLGVNLVDCNYAIFESFSSSTVNINQKLGRLKRLNPNDLATAIVIVPLNTQSEAWFKEGFKDIDYEIVTDLNSLKT